jgi:nucleoside phosphorylase
MPDSKKALIITALPLEYKAVRGHLSGITEVDSDEGVPYENGRFLGKHFEYSVTIAQLIEAGNEEAALATQEAMATFGPDLILFVGVAGGLKDVALGDVVVATKIYGYEYGAAKRSFQPRPDVGRSNHTLIRIASFHSKTDTWSKRLTTSQSIANRVFVGPIAAGSAVVKSKQSAVARLLRENYGDALAVEMEGAGFLRAAWREGNAKAVVVRGISDLIGGKDRTDRAGWQIVAADHAAAFAFELLDNYGKSLASQIEEPANATTAPNISGLIATLLGRDPVAGNDAIQEIGQKGESALPEMKAVLRSCGVNEYLDFQASLRMPRAFGLIGEPAVPVLLEEIRTGPWAAKVTAGTCFRFLRQTDAATQLSGIVRASTDADAVRCAIEALGWLNSSDWAFLIEEATFERSQYEFEKYWFYALFASLLMLGFEEREWTLAYSADRIERIVSKLRGRKYWSKDSYWIAVRKSADHFLPLGTTGLRSWLGTEDDLIHGAAGYIVQRRRPPYIVDQLASYAKNGRSLELRQASLFALGEIGTKRSCEAVVLLMEWFTSEGSENSALGFSCMHAMSKMFHHLEDDQHEKYSQVPMGDLSLVNSWYSGNKWKPNAGIIAPFLDSNHEWVRRPAAVCMGLHGQTAQPALKRYLRHASTPLDKAFILAGLIRSGAKEFCNDLYSSLGEARQVSLVDYIWKRELLIALSQDSTHGRQRASAWADLLRVDLSECAEEIAEMGL